jgi:hypothetical protein
MSIKALRGHFARIQTANNLTLGVYALCFTKLTTPRQTSGRTNPRTHHYLFHPLGAGHVWVTHRPNTLQVALTWIRTNTLAGKSHSNLYISSNKSAENEKAHFDMVAASGWMRSKGNAVKNN